MLAAIRKVVAVVEADSRSDLGTSEGKGKEWPTDGRS